MSLLLSACGLLGGDQEATEADVQQAEIRLRLECTDSCRERGQCGVLENEETVVLGHSVSPHTTNHDVLFPNGTIVTEMQTQSRTASSQVEERLNILFHEVRADDGQRGWVADWCVVGIEPVPQN